MLSDTNGTKDSILYKREARVPIQNEEMKEWLVNHKGFSETKVANGLERLQKCQGKKNQTRLDCFFK